MVLRKSTILLVLCMAVVALAFVVHKASHADITHDEALSYNHFLEQNVFGIITYQEPSSPVVMTNNHVLNSLGMKLFVSLFGTSELAVRMSSIIACILYMLCVWRIVKNTDRFLVVPFFALFVFNPFLLDFFALARGYALAISCMMWSIYSYSRYLETKESKSFKYSLCWAILAVLANFALLHYFIILIVLYNLFNFIDGKGALSALKGKNIPSLVAFLALSVLICGPLIRIIRGKLIDFGGVDGFWSDTIVSIEVNTMYTSKSLALFLGMRYFVLFITFAIPALWIIKLTETGRAFYNDNKFGLFGFLTVVLLAFDSEMQHAILGTPYLTERFALFVEPLIILNVILFFNALAGLSKKKIPVYTFVLAIALVMTIHTFIEYTPDFYPIWKADMNDKWVIEELEKEHKNGDVQLGITWYFEPALNYYRTSRNLTWLHPLNRDGLKDNDNYEYVLNTDTIPSKYKTEVIKSFSNSESLFVRRL